MPSMLTRVAAATGAVVVGTALLTGATLIPVRTPVEKPVEVRVGRHAVCGIAPVRQGDVTMLTTASTRDVSVAPIGLGATQQVPEGTVVPIVKPKEPRRLNVLPGSHGSGTSVIARGDGLFMGLAGVACLDPSTRSWLVGIPSNRSRVSDVVLTNADEIPAEVDLNYYGAGGRIVAQSGHSAVVRPGETVVIALEPIINESGPITVEVRSAQGRVAAMVRSRGLAAADSPDGTGVDWVSPSTAPRTDLVIPAVPAGKGMRQLVMTNPSEKVAEASIEVLGRDGFISLTGNGVSPVRGGETTVIDIDGLLPPGGGALRIHSSEPITASLRIDHGTEKADFATSPSAALITSEALMPLMLQPAQATLYVANPGDRPSTATLTVRAKSGEQIGQPVTTQIAPHTSAQVSVPGEGPVSAHLAVTEPVAASVVLTQKTGPMEGMAIMPLHPASSESTLVTPEHDTRVGG